MNKFERLLSTIDRLKRRKERIYRRAHGPENPGSGIVAKQLREVRNRRVGELHPDKMGREQTAAERDEFVKLTNRNARKLR